MSRTLNKVEWVKPTHQARSQETLERILEAAEELVSERGFDNATVSEIVRRASPGYFPAPPGTLYAAAGALESEEFLRQNTWIRERWGSRTVPVCETIAGTHHLNVLHELVDSGARLHKLAKELLGLAG